MEVPDSLDGIWKSMLRYVKCPFSHQFPNLPSLKVFSKWLSEEMFLEEAAKDSAKACAVFLGFLANSDGGKPGFYRGETGNSGVY